MYTQPRTIRMLARWADVILVAEPHMAAIVPPRFAAKVRDTGIGPDRWNNPLAGELLELAEAALARHGL